MIMRESRSSLALTLGAILAASAPLAALEAETLNTNFGYIDKNGTCGVALPFDDGKKLEINVRSNDGNVNVRLQNLDGAMVRAGEERDENVPITLIFDDGSSVTTDVGYYSAGFYYEVRGYWNDSADGAALISGFADAQNITVKFDGKTFGPISTQANPINLAYGMVKSCVKRNGGTMPGEG